MSQIYAQAEKTVNAYVELFDGDMKEVRRQVLLDVDFLFREGTDGARFYALTLDHVYHMLVETPGAK